MKKVTFERTTERHDNMPWTGKFDDEGRAIFECPICGRIIALGGFAEPRYKRLAQGNFWAAHSAYVTLEIVTAALEQEIWPQAPGNHKALEAWREAGGGPPFTISGVESKQSD
jgi:hypothetical protein